MSLISLIIPTFNRADIVQETVRSIQMQTHQQWEALCVDDGSTDNTYEVLKAMCADDKRIKVFRRPNNICKGANGCRNFGFSVASGEYVKWVDSDDLLLETALSKQLTMLESNSHLKVCFGQGVFFNNDSGSLEERWSREVQSYDIAWDYIRNNIRWPIGGPLWRKSFFSAPPFDEALKNSQEWLMHGQQLLRLAPTDYCIIDDVVYLIRRGNVRMSSSRNGEYFYNQAKARRILWAISREHNVPLKIQLELLKQVAIYTYHWIARTIIR